MTTLHYKPHSLIEDLALGEYTMHRASGSTAARWWQLWFNVPRDSDGVPEVFCVPCNPNGPFLPSGPGGKTWGLANLGQGTWQVSPSINVLNTGNATNGTNCERAR